MKMLTWQIGEIKITQLIEIHDAGNVIQETIPHATPENVKPIEWLRPHFADKDGHLKGVVQAFLIESAGERLLIDTCVGNGKKRVDLVAWNNLQTNFLGVLSDAGCDPQDVDKVVCTHLHFDHVGWNTKWDGRKWVPTFPKARYLISREEFEYWKKNPENEIQDHRAGFADSVLPVNEAGLVSLVELDAEVCMGVKFLPTPGHTPSHVSIYMASKDASAVITGDAMHHPCQIAQPDWHTVGDTFPDQAKQSRRKLLSESAGTPTIIIGSHFAQPTAGLIKRDGINYRFVP
jgi:glyoxylase-like metal-dependent hydrolase (beta-lactamase superfamily II)